MPPPGDDLRQAFQAQVARGALDAALDLSVVEFDELAQLTTVTVMGVEVTATAIAVHYTVSWSSFHACDDRTFGGQNARVLRGRADGQDWVFDPLEPMPISRSAFDEL
ncbi:hypothetical protein [Pelomonas cellulosilytica]|uniref:SnoaL-like domain-containing protein n=1 Tax=Pelomonas cellulosilytica TaxID=2906762 RepID=A0ABS8XY77_9BURK|nr:hypothetical protein [Pelomonas sp. P8]MCE4556225.1 hypothetical protein [Pelomonas sp. P8]